jgi:hypothetical protein
MNTFYTVYYLETMYHTHIFSLTPASLGFGKP